MSNSFYVCFEDEKKAERLTKLHIKALNEAALICDVVIEVVKQFDGKVLNVRFENALREKTGDGFGVKTTRIMAHHYENFEIYWWINKRDVPNEDGCSVSYIDPHQIWLCNMHDLTVENSPVIDKRIVAKNLIPEIEKRKTELIEEANILQQSIGLIDQWKERTRRLTEQVNQLHDEIPYEIKRYYGLDIPWSKAY